MYLEPLIIYKWKKEQVDLVKDLCEADKVIIGGDMRAGKEFCLVMQVLLQS